VRITPDPCMSMCRAAALAVRRWIVVPIMIGRLKSSSEISRSDVPERRAAKLSRVPARAQADVPRRVRKLDRAANRANQHAWPNLRTLRGRGAGLRAGCEHARGVPPPPRRRGRARAQRACPADAASAGSPSVGSGSPVAPRARNARSECPFGCGRSEQHERGKLGLQG
jgi:hypothetical protein